jgi:predicted XRE-type DNA-binding protein
MAMNNEITIAKGCGNVYADLGLPDADGMLVKAQLALSIDRIIRSKGLSQINAARIIGLSQPKLSGMLNGKFRGISEAKMLECITRLGNDVQIIINPAAHSENSVGHIAVSMV